MTFREWFSRQPRRTLVAVAIVAAGLIGAWSISVEAFLRARLDPGRVIAPTRLYARPIVLQPGTPGDPDRVRRHLRRLGYRETRGRRVAIGEFRLARREWTIGLRPFRFADRVDSGGVARVLFDANDRVALVLDRQGAPQPYLALEPELLRTVQASDGADRVSVTLDDVPRHLVDAILATEDRRFFRHRGLDVHRIAGAAVANLKAGRVTQGASTITQQLARTLWLSTDRSPLRKVREAALALGVEQRHTKETILQAYLNEVYLGQDGALAIRGVGRAAQFYFGKDVTQLGLAESALLAGIIRGPSVYSPFRHPEAARQRRAGVLDQMHARGALSHDDHRAATRAPLGLRTAPEPTPVGRYFTAHVLRELGEAHGRRVVGRGLAAFTTLDAELQRAAERAVAQGLEGLERAHPRLRREAASLQAALVALDPWSGEVLAMVGGRDFGRSQFNRATMARRQPGSAFKPIVALAALAPPDRGGGGERDPPAFTLASLLADDSLALDTPAGRWRPTNYDDTFRGPVTLRHAIEQSLNVPFARLGIALGPERIAAVGRALGIESRLEPVPSLALGASEVSVLELTRAFGVLGAYGYRARSRTTLAVLDHAGEPLDRAREHGEPVVTPAVAYLVTSALEGAVERGTGRGLRRFGYDGPVAAKSGTTNQHRDAWFVGYTPSLAIGVWVGFDDGESVGMSGAGAALPIFARFLVSVPSADDEFPMPPGVEVVEVDPATGLRAGFGCWGEPEVFLAGTAPEDVGCSSGWRLDRAVAGGASWLARRLYALGRWLGGEER